MPSPLSARIFKVFFGLFLILMGVGGATWLWRSFRNAAETQTWKPVEAVIITSEVLTERRSPHSPLSYVAEVHYRYTWEGKPHTSSRIRRPGAVASPHKDKVQAIVAAHRVGTVTECYVDPEHPDVAILEHESRYGPLGAMFFPLLFVVGGVGMIVSVLRSK